MEPLYKIVINSIEEERIPDWDINSKFKSEYFYPVEIGIKKEKNNLFSVYCKIDTVDSKRRVNLTCKKFEVYSEAIEHVRKISKLIMKNIFLYKECSVCSKKFYYPGLTSPFLYVCSFCDSLFLDNTWYSVL